MSKQPIRLPMDLASDAPARDRISVEAQAIIDAAARRVIATFVSEPGDVYRMLGLEDVAA